MATLDYTVKEAKTITLTNERKEIESPNIGATTGPFATKKNILNTDIAVPMFQTNVQKVLKKGDAMKITPGSSEEVVFYMNLNIEGLKVDIA